MKSIGILWMISACTLMLTASVSMTSLNGYSTIVSDVDYIVHLVHRIYTYMHEDVEYLDQIRNVITAVSNRIEPSKQLIMSALLFEQNSKIEEIQMRVYSLMVDLMNVMQAKEPERSEYRKIFVERAQSAIPRCRYLSKHLLKVMPEFNRNIIEMWANVSRCNLTALNNSLTDMTELMLNSLLLETTLVSMSVNINFKMVTVLTEFWGKEIEAIWFAFNESYTSCELQISQLVSEDINKCHNSAQLQRENKQRYHWKWCDVFMFEHATPKIFAAYEVKPNQSFSESSLGLTKIVTFGTETVQTTQLTDVLMAIVDDEHIYGSYHAGEIMLKIKLGLWKRHIKYSAVVVFFNNDEHKPDVEIDKDSLALRVDLEEMHCTSSFCPLIWSNWLKLNLNLKGYFTAYVVFDPAQKLDPNIIKKCSGAVCVSG